MSKKDWDINDPEDTFWFNTRTGEVEAGPQSLGIDRIGPFDSYEAAAHGPQLLAERARKLREEDENED